MGKRDWSRARKFKSAGVSYAETLSEEEFAARLERPSKADLRADLALALGDFNGRVTRLPTLRFIKCPCGHRATVPIADADRGKRLRCRRCGSVCL